MLHAQQCNWWATSIKLFYGDDDEGAAAPAGITRLGGVEPMGDIAAAGTGPLDAGEGDLRETAVTVDVTLPTGGCCGCSKRKSTCSTSNLCSKQKTEYSMERTLTAD